MGADQRLNEGTGSDRSVSDDRSERLGRSSAAWPPSWRGRA